MTSDDDAIPAFTPIPDAVLADLEQETRLRGYRRAAELTAQTGWPFCPLHLVPLRDDATCGQCSPEPEPLPSAKVARMKELRDRLALATEFTVCPIPEDDINHGAYAIAVTYRGKGRWAVTRHRWCLGTDGEWDFEMRPSEREDEWLDAHRFDLDTALRLAHEAAPGVEVNGITAAEVAARYAKGDDQG